MNTDSIWTKAFWKRLVENGIHAFSGGMLGILMAQHFHLISQIPFTTSLQAGAYGALISTLLSLGGQAVPNTAPGSFIPPKTSEE